MARLETEGSGPSLNRMSSFGPQGSAPSMSAGGRVGVSVQTLNLSPKPWRPGGFPESTLQMINHVTRYCCCGLTTLS